MKTKLYFFLIVLLFSVFLRCSSDVPKGYEEIDVTFSENSDSMPDEDYNSSISLLEAKGIVKGRYSDVHFRCSQEICGYEKKDSQKINILIQPCDMNPSSVPKCGGRLYDVKFERELSKGEYTFTLYQRNDNYGSDTTAKAETIGEEKVNVE